MAVRISVARSASSAPDPRDDCELGGDIRVEHPLAEFTWDRLVAPSRGHDAFCLLVATKGAIGVA